MLFFFFFFFLLYSTHKTDLTLQTNYRLRRIDNACLLGKEKITSLSSVEFAQTRRMVKVPKSVPIKQAITFHANCLPVRTQFA